MNFGTSDHPLETDVTLNDEIDLTKGHGSGTVNVTTNGSATINTKIKVSDSDDDDHPSKKGGNIAIESRETSGTAISVTSSAQLLSLLNNTAVGPGGSIKFVSAGGDVNVNGSKITADRGTVDIRNNGQNGVVNVDNATIHANAVKISALGKHGQLNIGGGTISADSAIDLYAGGSNGQVTFTDNVTLSGTSVKTISGDTVTIRDGKIVTISGAGPASVFTNRANYSGSGGNGSTTGTFGGRGATTSPLNAGPGPGG